MKYKSDKIIFLVITGLFLVFNVASAKNFIIHNASDINQPYFTVNGDTGNIGLGLNNPSTLLQIKNNNWISALNSTGTGAINMFKVNSSNQIEVGAPLNIGSFEFSPDSGLITFVDMPVSNLPAIGTPQGYVFKVDGENIMSVYSEANGSGGIQNSRIGIGMAIPSYPLDVTGTGQIETGLYFNNSTANGAYVWNRGSGPLRLASNNVERIRIDSSGNVGIGTDTPPHRLSISGSTTNYSIDAGNKRIGNVSDPDDNKDVVTLGYLNSSLSAFAPGGASSTWAISGNNIYNTNTTGNVGIGTASPLRNLDVIGSLRISTGQIFSPATFSFLNDGNGAQTTRMSGILIGTSYDSTPSNNEIRTTSNQSLTINARGTGNLYFNTADNNKLTILNNGNVGIGMTAPTYKLSVGGTLNIGLTSENGSGLLRIGSGSSGAFTIQGSDATGNVILNNANTTGGDIDIQRRGSSAIYVKGSNGNVGIGTATPPHRLSISGSTTNYSIDAGNKRIGNVSDPDDNKDVVTLGYLNSSLSAFAPGGASSTWAISGNNIYNTNTAGNVGIGTMSPGAKLDVNGTARFTGKVSKVTDYQTEASTFDFTNTKVIQNIKGLYVGTTANGYISIGLPKTGNVMPDITITVSDYSSKNIVKYRVQGYWYGTYWHGNGNKTIVEANSSVDQELLKVTLAADPNGNPYILIGTPTTKFGGHININLDEVKLRYSSQSDVKWQDSANYIITQGVTDVTDWSLLTAAVDVIANKDWVSSNYSPIISGTANQTLHHNGTYWVANSNLYNNGTNVGIGTATPPHKLSISGSTTNYSIDAGNKRIGNVSDPDDNKDVVTLGYLNSSLSAFAPGGASSTWAISGNNIYNTNTTGNVGIGTSSPQFKLDLNLGAVNSNSNIGYNVFADATASIGYSGYNLQLNNSTANASGYLRLARTSGTAFLGMELASQSRDGIRFLTHATAPSETMRINASGNVGIGTANPLASLQVGSVANSFYSLTSGKANFIGANINPSATTMGTINASSNSITGSAALNTGYGPSITFTQNVSQYVAGYEKVIGGIKSYLTPTGNVNSRSSLGFFTHNDTSLSERMTIDYSGNVGIGTTSPPHKLSISGSTTNYSIDAGNKRIGNVSDPDDNKDVVTLGYLNSSLSAFAPGGASSTWAISGNNIYNTNTTGNVGIGTVIPTQKLDVSGVITASTGFRVNNAVATAGQYLRGNGTNFVASTIQASDVPTLNQNTTGSAGTLLYEDRRTISPSNLAANRMKFGFTSYNNNNSSPWADFIHLRSYQDSSGGKDNLLVFNKASIGMRLYQQDWGSSNAYSVYKDVLMSDNSPVVNYLTKYTVAGTGVSVGKSIIYDNNSNVGIGTDTPPHRLSISGSTTNYSIDAGNKRIGNVSDPDDNKDVVTLGYLNSSLSAFAPGGASSTWAISGNNIYNTNTTGNVGIGVNNPSTLLTLANNGWISAQNSAGTGHINMFRLNTNNEIEVGAPLNINQFQFAQDSGYNTFVDMPVSSASALGSIQGYTMKIDGENILSIYSESNGSGGIQNKRIGVGTGTPTGTLHVKTLSSAQNEADSLIVGGDTNATMQLRMGRLDSGSYTWIQSASKNTSNERDLILNPSGGNVGIGITSTSQKLHVAGGLQLGGVAFGVSPGSSQTTALATVGYVNAKVGGADGLVLNRRAVANANYTAQDIDYLIAFTSLTANRTLTLPTSICTAGKALLIANETSSTYSVIVSPQSGTISGYSSFSLPKESVIPVYCNGTNWFIY